MRRLRGAVQGAAPSKRPNATKRRRRSVRSAKTSLGQARREVVAGRGRALVAASSPARPRHTRRTRAQARARDLQPARSRSPPACGRYSSVGVAARSAMASSSTAICASVFFRLRTIMNT